MEKEIILKREQFLEEYANFNLFLTAKGFRIGHYWRESSTSADYHYSEYNDYIDSMHSVEHYINDDLNLSLRFLRDRNEHKIMFIGQIGAYSNCYNLEEAKDLINEVIQDMIEAKKIQLENLISKYQKS